MTDQELAAFKRAAKAVWEKYGRSRETALDFLAHGGKVSEDEMRAPAYPGRGKAAHKVKGRKLSA